MIDWWTKYEMAKQKQKQRLGADKKPDNEESSQLTAANTSSQISEIELYNCELEKTKQFRQMFSVLDTFPLYKGKSQSSYTKDMQCHFKGQFMLYEDNRSLQENFSTMLQRNDGSFFCLKPSNQPIRVMLHVYVVKATIFGSFNEKESCYSYFSYKIGNKWMVDTENQALNTLSPIFGR